MRESMRNAPPSAEKYGARTVVKAVDECKNEQSDAIRWATLRQTVVKAVDEWKNEQYAAIRGAIRRENRCENR